MQTTLFKVVETMRPIGVKPFSQGNYDKYSIYETFLMDNIHIPHHNLMKNPDQHDIDILVLKNGVRVGALEAESHGKYWAKTKFPFKTCHFLYRKKKYIADDHFYVMMNRRAQNALMLPFNKLKGYKIKVMNNSQVRMERFYDVPIKECIVGWKTINEYLDRYFNGTQIKEQQPLNIR